MNMKNLILPLLPAGFLLAGAPHASAVITWIGGTDSNFYTTANWDFSSSSFSPVNFTAANTITDSMLIDGAAGVSLNGLLTIADNVTLTLNNATVTSSAANGIRGVNDVSDVFSLIALSGTSSLNVQFIDIGVSVTVGDGSTLTLRGTGDPLNSQTEPSRVVLAPGGSLTFATATEYTEHTAEIFNSATGNNLATAPGDFSPNSGATITAAVPEPSSALLGVLGSLALFRRRRA